MVDLLNPGISRKITLLLSLLVTLFTGIVGALGADAGIRASNANRESQILATEITQELQRSGLQSNYELETLALYARYASEQLALQMAALELVQGGRLEEAEGMVDRAQVLEVQAARLKGLSGIFNNPRYMPANSEFPDLERYLSDISEGLNERVKVQNAASDRYNRYDIKSTNYLSIITLLSIDLFLLGLAQTVAPRIRIGLVGFSFLLFAAAFIWTLGTLFR
jgi:hypothetical protein